MPVANIIGIVGSYRENGVNDQLVTEILAGAAEAGATTRRVFLPDVDIEFCTNCRACMQEPGDEPGRCIHNDAMAELLDACVHADGIVLASPVNMGAVTAIMKRFMERLVALGYWPWGTPAPKMREGITPKSAVLVITSAAPTIAWRVGRFTAETTMRNVAKMLNAKRVRVLKYGLMGQQQHPTISDTQRAEARKLGHWLVSK
ncbi:MAG: flavodoxin family protein [Armatimonadota bacterium]|nr:flavodoxin family protein [bacterium]